METIKRFNKIAYLLSVFGFISTLFFCGLSFVLGMRMQTSSINLSGGGVSDLYQDLVSRYLFISICFLLFIGFLWMRNRIFLKLTGFVPLAVIILQSLIAITSKNQILQSQTWNYSSWSGMSYVLDICLLTLTVVLMILHLNSIRLIHCLPNYDNP